MQELSDTFDETILSGDRILVDFWAEWCGPCKTMLPILEEIHSEGTVEVAKVNVDQNQSLAIRYGVKGIPTMILFEDGEEVQRIVGARSKEALVEEISTH